MTSQTKWRNYISWKVQEEIPLIRRILLAFTFFSDNQPKQWLHFQKHFKLPNHQRGERGATMDFYSAKEGNIAKSTEWSKHQKLVFSLSLACSWGTIHLTQPSYMPLQNTNLHIQCSLDLSKNCHANPPLIFFLSVSQSPLFIINRSVSASTL